MHSFSVLCYINRRPSVPERNLFAKAMTGFSNLKHISQLVSLASRRAIVTGGARGIGLAICYRLAEAGASVLIADIDRAAAEQACGQLSAAGNKAIPVQCDISSDSDIQKMIQSAVEKMGGLDILVNNAGIYPRKNFLDVTAQDFDTVMKINLRGTFLCSSEAGRQMIRQNTGGCIINISSIDAIHPSQRGMAVYDASKGALITLTRSLALELAPNDIRVNAIAPGGILTEGVITESEGETLAQSKARLSAFMERMPLGRMGRPDDVAGAALFLASGLADYITGTVITVDGGYLIS